MAVGLGVAIGMGVAVGSGVVVGSGVAVGPDVAVGSGVVVGSGVAVGSVVVVGSGVAVSSGGAVGSDPHANPMAIRATAATSVATFLSRRFSMIRTWVSDIARLHMVPHPMTFGRRRM